MESAPIWGQTTGGPWSSIGAMRPPLTQGVLVNTQFRHFRPLLFATALLVLPPIGWTQEAAPPAPEVTAEQRDTLFTIVVTAQRREQDSQKVPVAIDVLGMDDLADIGFTNVTDITQRVPALKIQPFNYSSAVLDLRMRGVGSLNTISTSNDPAVGVYVDDVYIARSAGLTMRSSRYRAARSFSVAHRARSMAAIQQAGLSSSSRPDRPVNSA